MRLSFFYARDLTVALFKDFQQQNNLPSDILQLFLNAGMIFKFLKKNPKNPENQITYFYAASPTNIFIRYTVFFILYI